jgi:hypothetical protein
MDGTAGLVREPHRVSGARSAADVQTSPTSHRRVTLETLVASITPVTLAEIGDKTQLLSFVVAAKLRRP